MRPSRDQGTSGRFKSGSRAAHLSAALFSLSMLIGSLAAQASATFVQPPLGTYTFNANPPCTGSDSCGISPPYSTQPGGVTWTYSNVQLSDWSDTWYGPKIDQIFEFTGAPFHYVSFTSTSSTTALVYYGISQAADGYVQRLVMQYNSFPNGGCPNLPLTMTTSANASIADDGTIGVVAQVKPNSCLSINFEFEVCSGTTASCPFADTGAEWQPAEVAFAAWSASSNQIGPQQFPTSFWGGFYYNNTAPMIGPISDLTLSTVGNPVPSVPVGPIIFTLADDGEASAIVLASAASTNTAVVDPGSIVLANNGDGTGSISFTVLPQIPFGGGTSTISFKATDGLGAFTMQSFKVTANGDTPPTISDPSPLSIVVQLNSTSTPVTFTVGDAETPLQNLVVTAHSDTQSVISDANIAITQPDAGGNASVTVTSTAQSGIANITIDVSDGELDASTEFLVRVNAPPVFENSQPLELGQGATGTITTSLLTSSDPDGPSGLVQYIINGQPHEGTLYLSGSANPSSFTQNDIDQGNITYTNGGTCDTSDNFQFEIEDVDGGFANDPSQGSGPTTYSFSMIIDPTETAPTVSALNLAVGLGGSTSSNMTGTSTDCGPPSISFAVVNGPAHGQLTGVDASSGAFTYTANQGFQGTDTFTYTGTTYGNQTSAPATVSIAVQPGTPTANAGTLVTHENDAASGTLTATDPDLPPPAFTFAIATPPAKGTVTITNAATGAYNYVPNSNTIGADSFAFTATAFSTSAPATIAVQIRPYLKTGNILVTDQGSQNIPAIPTSVVLIDPVSKQQAVFSQDAQYDTLQGIALEADGHVLVSDTHNHTVFRIDPITGAATVLSSAFGNPANIAVEADGHIVVADFGTQSIIRIDPTTGAQVGTAISLGSGTLPASVAVAADTTLWATDVGGTFFHTGANNLWTVAANGANPQIFSGGNFLNLPFGLVLGSNGDAYVSTFGAFIGGPNNIVHIDSGGTQSLLTSDGNLDGAASLAFGNDGQLYVTSVLSAAVVGVDPSNGNQTPLSTGGLLTSPFGIAVAKSVPGVDLAVTVIPSHTYLPGGRTTQFTVKVTNSGNQAATGAKVGDILPGNLSGETWTCQGSTGAVCTASGNGSIDDTITVPVGGSITYTVTVTVAKLPETMTTYTAIVDAPVGVTDYDTSNNSSSTSEYVKIFASGFE